MSAGGLGDLTIVERATNNPGCCVLTGAPEGPFLNLGRRINYIEPHAYIHVPFVEEMGRAVGMVDAAAIDALEQENEELRAENEALQAAFDALSGVKQEVEA